VAPTYADFKYVNLLWGQKAPKKVLAEKQLSEKGH
jgi:hypothetical protein